MAEEEIEGVPSFIPEPWQADPFNDTSPVVLLTGSAGGGKSYVAAMKLHLYCATYPGTTALALRKTRESMTNSTVLFLDREIIGATTRVRHIPSRHRFEYSNGSIFAYGGMADEKQRQSVRSIGQSGGLDIVWMEEANKFVEDDFQEVIPRMRGRAAPWRQIILTTNPDSDQHWILKRLINDAKAKVYYSSAKDNTHNPDDYRDSLNKLTGVMRMRMRDGLWVTAEGAVYQDWSSTVHMIDPFEIPRAWRRFRSIDFGYTNPFVCQWWALDHDDRAYLYREIYMSGRIVSDHAADINRLSFGEQFEQTIADHDAEDRATLASCGIHTLPAIKDVSAGIQAVSGRLRSAGDGKPRMFIMRNALYQTDVSLEKMHKPTCTADEFSGYVWAHGKLGPKEAPVKENDHGLDALRYFVMSIDKSRPKARVLPNPWLRSA